MKNFILSLVLFLGYTSVGYSQEGAEISFEEEKYSFGELNEGPKVSHEFTFTNTGTEPLVLSNVKASCGCTTPSWPKDPILPGEEGTIFELRKIKKSRFFGTLYIFNSIRVNYPEPSL